MVGMKQKAYRRQNKPCGRKLEKARGFNADSALLESLPPLQNRQSKSPIDNLNRQSPIRKSAVTNPQSAVD